MFTIRRPTNFTSELNEIVFFDLWKFAVQFDRSAVNIKTAGIVNIKTMQNLHMWIMLIKQMA